MATVIRPILQKILLNPRKASKFKRIISSEITQFTGLTMDRLCWMLKFNVLEFIALSFHGIQDSLLRFLVRLMRFLAVASLQAVHLPWSEHKNLITSFLSKGRRSGQKTWRLFYSIYITMCKFLFHFYAVTWHVGVYSPAVEQGHR